MQVNFLSVTFYKVLSLNCCSPSNLITNKKLKRMKTILIALIASIGIYGKTTSTVNPGIDYYNFTSDKLNFQLTIPLDLKNNLIINETENSVVFKYDFHNYSNTVFLFSINKVADKSWIQLQDNLKNTLVLNNKGGYITYSEIAQENNLQGKNKNEFKNILTRVNELLKSYKEI